MASLNREPFSPLCLSHHSPLISQPLDIRRIPSLYTNETLRNTTGHIVLFDMLRQLKKARDSLGVIGGGGGDGLEEGKSTGLL
jgi:hypothetical protein